MTEDHSKDDPSATRTSIGAATLLKKNRLLAGRYRIIGPIGAGGMGLVYRAHDERLGLDIAVKVLRPERTPDKSMLERFERELVLAREVSHPNVVRIHDIGEDGDLQFITMDLVDGRSVRELLEDEGPFSTQRAVAIAADIAEGLDAAHRKSVVHRDLKPANILIDKQGVAYISDFGVARSLHAANLTVTGMIVGSPDYLSPEQARGDELDGRTDIYALGLILYEMLSGELPFRGGTIEELIVQHAVGEPRDFSDTDTSVPPWLRRIVYCCLQKDPADRFETAAELAQALRSGSAPRTRLSRSATRTIGGMAAMVAVVVLAVFASRFLPEASKNPTVRLAALPMSNDTGRTELQWLASGINDMLDTHFSESSTLEFIETSRIVDTLADLKLDPTALDDGALEQMAELLSVDRILTGALRQSGDGLRIDASLRRSDGGRAKSIVATTDQVSPHELIASLAAAVSDNLAITAPISDQVVLSSSADALESYALGKAALRQADTTAAIPLFEQAVKADPGFAVAWFYLADAYDMAGYTDSANVAIRQAADRNSDTDTLTGLNIGALRAALDGNFEESRRLLARLIKRFPSDIPARMALAEAYGDEGLFDEASEILNSVVQVDDNHPRAWFLLGKYAIQAGDSRRAIDNYLVRDLVIQNRLKSDYGRANVFNAMGIAYDRLGQSETARENYERAAILRGQIGDQRGMATSLNNLARLQMMEGNFDDARASLVQAKKVSRELGDDSSLAAFTNTLGTLEEEAGNYAGALDAFREALKLREALGDRRALTESFNNVGFAYYMLGQLDNARLYWERALDESRDLANLDGEMLALQSLGLLHTARGESKVAQKYFIDALGISRDLNYPEAEAVSVGNIGQIAALQGRYDAALSQLDEALRILQGVGDTRGLTEFSLHRAEVLVELGLANEANQQLNKVKQWLGETPNLEQQAEYMRLRARLADGPDGRELLLRAIDEARRSGGVAAVMQARLALADREIREGNFARALDIATAVAVEANRAGYTTVQLRALLSQALATAALGNNSEATAITAAMLTLLEDHGQFAESYRIHALAADIFGATGREEDALRQRTLAVEGIASLRGALPEAAIELFDARTEVSRLRNEALVDGK